MKPPIETSSEPVADPKPTAFDRALVIFHRLGPAGPLAVVAASMPAIGGFVLLGSIQWFSPWLRAHTQAGILLCIFAYALLGGLALLPTYAHAVLCGWAFGFNVGFPVAMCAFTGAAILGYIFARYLSGDRVIRLIQENAKSRVICDALIGSGFLRTLLIVILLRLPPNSPFAMTTLALAATRVHPMAFFLGTVIGMAPRTGIIVFLAAGLSELSFSAPRNPWFIAGSIVLTLGVLSIIGYVAKQALSKLTEPARSASE